MGVAGGREEQQPPPPQQQLEKQQQEDELEKQQQLRPQPQSPHPSSSFARASSRQQRQQRRAEEEQSLSPQPQSPHPRKKKRQGGWAFKVAEDGQSAFALQAAAIGGGSGGGGGGDEGRRVGAPAGPTSPAGVDAQLLFGGARGFRNRPEGAPLPGAGAGRRRGRGGGTSFCVIS